MKIQTLQFAVDNCTRSYKYNYFISADKKVNKDISQIMNSIAAIVLWQY